MSHKLLVELTHEFVSDFVSKLPVVFDGIGPDYSQSIIKYGTEIRSNPAPYTRTHIIVTIEFGVVVFNNVCIRVSNTNPNEVLFYADNRVSSSIHGKPRKLLDLASPDCFVDLEGFLGKYIGLRAPHRKLVLVLDSVVELLLEYGIGLRFFDNNYSWISMSLLAHGKVLAVLRFSFEAVTFQVGGLDYRVKFSSGLVVPLLSELIIKGEFNYEV